jgi:hypothetical protein
VLLTRGEVRHHQDDAQSSALAIVSGIRLIGPPDEPEAVDGTLRIIEPWVVHDDALTPLAFRYVVPPA